MRRRLPTLSRPIGHASPPKPGLSATATATLIRGMRTPAASHNRIPLVFPPLRTRRASSAKPHASALRLARQLAAQARQRQRALPPQFLADDTAARLLAVLYQDGLVDLANFNAGELGRLLAKLTAAGFCEIGVNAIWITQSGQNFVGSLIPLSPNCTWRIIGVTGGRFSRTPASRKGGQVLYKDWPWISGPDRVNVSPKTGVMHPGEHQHRPGRGQQAGIQRRDTGQAPGHNHI